MSSPPSQLRGRWRLGVAFAIALILLWYFFHNIPFRDIWGAVQHAHFGLLAAAVAVTYVTYVFRAWRWQALLLPLGPAPFGVAFRTTVIGFTATNLLPGRIGEVLRPYLYARSQGVRFTSAFATVVLERLLDLVTVFLLFGCFVLTNDLSSAGHVMDVVKVLGVFGALASLAALLVLFVCAGHPERLGHLAVWTVRALPARAGAAVARLVRTFADGLVVLRRPAPLVLAAALSVPVWLSIALGIWLTSRAFDLTVSFTGAFLVMMFLMVGVAVPTPGGVGPFEAAYQYSVTHFFGAAMAPATAGALVLHAVSVVPTAVLGILFMGQEGLTFAGLAHLRAAADDAEPPASTTAPPGGSTP